MIAIEQLNQWAETWVSFMTSRTLDTVMIFALVGIIWFFIRNRVSPQFGYLLFMLVLIKVMVPVQVSLPTMIAYWYPNSVIQENVNSIGKWDWNIEFGSGAGSASKTVKDEIAKPVEPVIADTISMSWIACFMIAWGVGVLVFLLNQFWVEWKTRFMMINTVPLDLSQLPVNVKRLKETANIKCNVKWVTGDWVKSPIAYGYFRPVIAVPADIAQHYSDQQIRWILLHELAHIKRGDSIVAFIQRLIQAFFFFNPFIWWTNSILDQQREYACDDTALLGSQAMPKECGEGFLGVVMQANGLPTFVLATHGMVNYKTMIRRRLMRIIDHTRRIQSRMSGLSSLCFMIIALLILPFSLNIALAQVGEWVNVTPLTDLPDGRVKMVLAHDTDRNMIIMYGGIKPGNIMANDTWEWDGNKWTLVSINGPGYGKETDMVYDEKNNEIILFGGRNQNENYQGITWKWDTENLAWNRIATSGPHPRSIHAMAYDSLRGVIVMHGGAQTPTIIRDDTWMWDGELSQWLPVSDNLQQNKRGPRVWAHRMAYDEFRDRMVIFGGNIMDDQGNKSFSNNIWEWDGTQWDVIEGKSVNWPTPRIEYGMTYDTNRKKIIIYGGLDASGVQHDMWEWDGSIWNEIKLNSSIYPKVGGIQLIFLPSKNQIFTFGGSENGFSPPYVNNTWIYQFQSSSVQNWFMFN